MQDPLWFCHQDHCLGGPVMERHRDEKPGRDDSRVLERQTAYSLDRLAVAVSEWNRLIETRPSCAIEQLLAHLDGAVDYTSITMEAVHKLWLWRANAHWLGTELDSAAGSFHLAERQLARRIDAALGHWEQRFEVGDPAITGHSGGTPGRPRVGPGRRSGGCSAGDRLRRR